VVGESDEVLDIHTVAELRHEVTGILGAGLKYEEPVDVGKELGAKSPVLSAVQYLELGKALSSKNEVPTILGELAYDRLIIGAGHCVEFVDQEAHTASAPDFELRLLLNG